MKMISRPKGWVKADAVRVRRNKGRLVVEIRRKKKRRANPKRKPAKRKPTRRKPARRKTTKKGRR